MSSTCAVQSSGSGLASLPPPRDETLSGAPCNATTTPTTVTAIPTASQNGEPTAIAVGMTLPPAAVSTIPPTVSRNVAQGFSATGPSLTTYTSHTHSRPSRSRTYTQYTSRSAI